MFQEITDFGKEHFYILTYLITLFIALANYQKYFDTVLRYFPVLIAYTFFNELLGYFIRYSEQFAFFEDITFANDFIYNIYDLIYYSFFYWVYWSLATSNSHKNIIKILAFTVLCSYAVSVFFQNPLIMSLYYATSLASSALVVMIFLYWKNNCKDRSLIAEKHNLMFWVSAGLFIFHIILPILYLQGVVNSQIWYEYNFQMILRISIVIMYSLFCIGLIKSYRRAFR